MIERWAELAVVLGAHVQPGQVVRVSCTRAATTRT
jgi:leucyl aminopeptidase (aminopeptidase T)